MSNVVKDDPEPDPDCYVCDPRDLSCFNATLCQKELEKYFQVFDDKILINMTPKYTTDTNQTWFPLMRSAYFLDKLEGLGDFDGFFARSFVP